MKSMSQCFRYEDCFETLEEARAELKRLHELKRTAKPPVIAGNIEQALRDALNDDITAWLATAVVPTKADLRLHNLSELVERLTGVCYTLSASANASPSYSPPVTP